MLPDDDWYLPASQMEQAPDTSNLPAEQRVQSYELSLPAGDVRPDEQSEQ